MSSYTWAYQTSPSVLAQQVETYADLRLPPTSSAPPLNPIDRYVADLPTGVIVTHDTRSLCPPLQVMLPHDIAYSNTGSNYQRPLQDPADNESSRSGSNNLYYTGFAAPTESSSESPEEDDYPQQQQSSAATSPGYHGPTFVESWDQDHYMSQASDLNAAVDPDLAPKDFVCPKEVHISSCGDDRSQEGHNDTIEDDDENCCGYPQTETMMFLPYDRQCYPYDQPTPPMGVYSHQHDNSLRHDRSCSSAQGSRQNSPDRLEKLKLNRARRIKCPRSMMQPYQERSGEGERSRKIRGEKGRGRGAGKKTKEKKVCRLHPTKVFAHASDYKKHMNQQHLRPFLCVLYFAGCAQTFGSKNEWKRHVYSQHLQISYWTCDDPLCADRKAIFNRKDLFGQHIKRMHPAPAGSKDSTTAYMDRMIDRCRVERRKPPQNSRCGYCNQSFEGPQSWDQRMEHVGQHYEKNNYKGLSSDCWVRDEGLVDWALVHGIIEDTGNGTYTIVSTGKDAIVKAGVEQKKLAKEEMARARGYRDVGDIDDDERDADGDDEYYYRET
ncbi:hypothetical protein C7212DRAFT_355334 [Tuber magnatum]|uniref:C2H2-type domain-containing protein n=1 Tax=Tuber magnatum TaxID=42249 RepID=A0A317SZG0_9PEZI|nr:hypothetical protein C7212DRAFT_355334 [Tuber magnatum]